jgi:probable rRNA maturation factor
MLEVEVFGAELAPGAPPLAEVRRLCVAAAASAGVSDGHVAVEFVDAERITRLNAEHRGKPTVTDVLSFPVDGVDLPGGRDSDSGLRELGDVMICPQYTADLREAIVHGVLHLVGMDHETDGGEMLATQDALLAAEDR